LKVVDLLEDWLPAELIADLNLWSVNKALNQIHFPKNQKLLNQAVRRLKFDELFLFQLQVQLTKAEINSSHAEPIEFKEKETKDFVSSLPFNLTNDQRKAAWQIISDLQKDKPMNRLLEGEVGSGKTVVAALAMLSTALSEKQSVLMAPTEILASQHYKNILNLFKNSKIKIALLTRSYNFINDEKLTKKKVLAQLKSGEVKIAIGTHAIIQEKVEFENLALAIIDEQHRFGVGQRKFLRQNSGHKKTVPHLLSMTATPIPRSLALTLYGDLDLSIIRELPKERKKIITKIVDLAKRNKTYDFDREYLRRGS